MTLEDLKDLPMWYYTNKEIPKLPEKESLPGWREEVRRAQLSVEIYLRKTWCSYCCRRRKLCI